MSTCSPDFSGKASFMTWLAWPDSPGMPAFWSACFCGMKLKPMTSAANTKASHPRMALRRCWTLQRPMRAAMLWLEESVLRLVWVRFLMAASFRFCDPPSDAAARRLVVRETEPLRTGHYRALPEAHAFGLLTHPEQARGHAGHHGVGRYVARDHRARADHGVVADRHAPEDAGAVADPHVVPHAHVALVDALQPDRPVHLDHPVVEVDHHHPVGDHALAPDRDVLVRRDRALLPHHGLRPDRDRALVAADLASVPHPRPPAQLERGPRPHLQAAPGTDEGEPVKS